MKILPAGSATRHWLTTGLALVLAMSLAATCQAGMVVKTDAPDDKANPAARPASAPAAMATPATPTTPAKSTAPAASSRVAPAAPAPAAQRPDPPRASVKTAPPAADRPLARPGNPAGPADRAGWPACIRQLNAVALSGQWDGERRQALLEQCP